MIDGSTCTVSSVGNTQIECDTGLHCVVYYCRSNTADVSVMIDGSTCTVSSVGNTQIECVTGPHIGSYSAKVEVEVGGNGIAQEVGSFYLFTIICSSMGENPSLGF